MIVHTDAPSVLTVDLEDWFDGLGAAGSSRSKSLAARQTYHLLDLLEAHSARATFFVLGDCAIRAPGLVRQIADAGHEIGSHGMSHQLLEHLGPRGFEIDLATSLDALSDVTGLAVTAYRAPYFGLNARTLWALDALREHGIQTDSSVLPAWHPRSGLPGATRLPHELIPGLVEWPVSAIPTPLGALPFSGGAWMRLLPGRLVAAAARATWARGEPLVAYLHPWELDPDHPRLPGLPWSLRVRHYTGLQRAEGVLTALLSSAPFVSLREAVDRWPIGSGRSEGAA